MDETDDGVEDEDKLESINKFSTQELAMLFPGKNVQTLEAEMETITLEPALPTPNGTSDDEGEEIVQAREEEEERPRKRARTTRPKKQFAKFAATALAGAIVGGVGVFATLVASANWGSVDLVDILEHEQGTTMERQADVFSLERVGVSGSRGVEWIEIAGGVG